ncbi:SDR family NAD(P)-dependent oxidoreductase [Shewanella sp. 10N.286.51.B8]|uniref:SDR family NAD(P)-dependent oxidoreductase n=1 Tax=Shewanella sp. 10N.286.51.B8 TaxID=3229708 RepID=UPI00354B52A3
MNVLITGGNGDLAKSIAKNLVSLGYCVLSPERDQLDVTDALSVENYFKDREFDIVINAAGTLYSSLIADSDPSEWIKDIQVNLIGTYLICRQAVVANKKTAIFNIASTAAFNSYPDWTSYCASKAGVVTLSKGMHKDGYNVCVICPGAIETKIRKNLKINNTNVLSIAEGVKPIIDAIVNKKFGEVVIYRKNEYRVEIL